MLVSSWPDVVVPTILILAWMVVSPVPLQFITWISSNNQNKKHSTVSRFNDDDAAAAASRHDKEAAENETTSSGYILPVMIHHARMLPKESQHRFRYPSIFLALNLEKLESGRIDLNRIFSWSPLQQRLCLTKLDPDGFGRRTFPGVENGSPVYHSLTKSIQLKLIYELRLREYLSIGPQDLTSIDVDAPLPWDKEVGQIWAVAMPTLLGMGGFNPLTVYYVYRPNEENESKEIGKLWLVVLEVHNTFNERHLYICQVGVDEDEDVMGAVKRRGYQHSWTFSREFHVSPFNDRLGYYQLLMSDLWNGEESAIEHQPRVPILDVRLLLLTPEEHEETDDSTKKQAGHLNKKLLATLTSSKAKSGSLKPVRSGLPMTSMNMVKAIASQPADLILPVSRIMWQAAKLHWKRRLPVFIRPEPLGQGIPEQDEKKEEIKRGSSYDGVGWPVDLNPTQPRKSTSSSSAASGAIYWNQDTFLVRACRLQFEEYIINQTSKHRDTCLCIQTRNAEVQSSYFYQGRKVKEPVQGDAHCLILYTLSSSFYLDFAMYTPKQARFFGSVVDRNWGVNSVSTYDRLFSRDIDSTSNMSVNWKSKVAAWARRIHMQWAMRCSAIAYKDRAAKAVARQLLVDVTSSHPYNFVDSSFSFLIALLVQFLIVRLTSAISALLRIRYVRPPWASVGEGYQKLVEQAQ